MSLHHGLTDLCDNHFTDRLILPWFPASSQASLRFCLRAKLISNHHANSLQLQGGCLTLSQKEQAQLGFCILSIRRSTTHADKVNTCMTCSRVVKIASCQPLTLTTTMSLSLVPSVSLPASVVRAPRQAHNSALSRKLPLSTDIQHSSIATFVADTAGKRPAPSNPGTTECNTLVVALSKAEAGGPAAIPLAVIQMQC